MTTLRTQHTTDMDLGGGQRRRTIANWSNYQTPEGVWAASGHTIKAASGETFLGRPLEWLIEDQPLQWFVGDAAGVGGRPWYGVRKSNDLDTGIVTFVETGNATTGYTVDKPSRSATWTNVLDDLDMVLTLRGHAIDREFIFKSATAGDGSNGDRVWLGFVLPENWTLEVLNSATPGNRFVIKRPNGNAVLRSRPAEAADDNGASVPCTFIQPATPTDTLGGVTYWRVQKRIDPTGAALPIRAGDTVEISGTTDIEDATLIDQTPDTNYGSLNRVQFGLYGAIGSSTLRRAVFRINESSIPAGAITGFTLECTRLAEATGGVNAANAVAHRILPANDWVEGTATAAVQTGSVCWNYAKYATQSWAGSGGCSTSGTDYEADASPPTTYYPGYPSGPDVAFSFTLDPAWCEGWRDADYANEGFVLFSEVIASSNAYMFQMYSSENATNPLTFEIEYSTGAPNYFNSINAMRRR